MSNFNLNGCYTNYDDASNKPDEFILGTAQTFKPLAFEGTLFNRLSGWDRPLDRTAFEIGGRTQSSLSGLLGDGSAGGWDATATTDLPIQSDYINNIGIGDTLEVKSGATIEVVTVKDIDRTAETIDVFARGVGSTTGAIWADGSAFSVIGTANNDGNEQNTTQRSEATYTYTNYAQTLIETVQYSKSNANEPQKFYQSPEVLEREALERIFKLMMRTTVKGVKGAGTKAGQPYTTAGLLDQISDSAGSTRDTLRTNIGGALTQAKLEGGLSDAHNYGSASTIICNLTNARTISGFSPAATASSSTPVGFSGTNLYTRNQGDLATSYEYNGMMFNLAIDRDMPTDRISISDTDKIKAGFVAGDELRYEKEGTRSSSRLEVGTYQCKFAVAVEGVGRDHVDLYGITS